MARCGSTILSCHLESHSSGRSVLASAASVCPSPRPPTQHRQTGRQTDQVGQSSSRVFLTERFVKVCGWFCVVVPSEPMAGLSIDGESSSWSPWLPGTQVGGRPVGMPRAEASCEPGSVRLPGRSPAVTPAPQWSFQ